MDPTPLTSFCAMRTRDTAVDALVFVKGLHLRIYSHGDTSADVPKPKLGKEAIAVATLMEHSDWSNEQIADEVGCHVKTLSSRKWGKFKAARAALSVGRTSMLKGSKDKESGDVEAWDDEE